MPFNKSKALIGKGYLQNLQIDLEERTVGLYVPEDAYAQWVCPNCGAKNRARKGGALRCKYCDQPMTNDGPSKAVMSTERKEVLP